MHNNTTADNNTAVDAAENVEAPAVATLETTVVAGSILPVAARIASFSPKVADHSAPALSIGAVDGNLTLLYRHRDVSQGEDAHMALTLPAKATGKAMLGLNPRDFANLVKGVAPLGTSKAAKAAELRLSCDNSATLTVDGDVRVDAPAVVEQGDDEKSGDKEITWEPLGEMAYHDLTEGLEFVRRASSTDVTLPALRGVSLEFSASELVMVTTDRFRLAAHRIAGTFNVDHEGVSDQHPLVSTATLLFLRDMVKLTGEDTLRLSISRDRQQALRIETDMLAMTINCIDAQFPKWGRLMPNTMTAAVTVDRKALATKIKQMARAIPGRWAQVRLNVDGDTLTLTGLSGNYKGEEVRVTGEVPATTVGSLTMIAFDPNYMLDALDSLDDDKVTFMLAGPDRPGLIVDNKQVADALAEMPTGTFDGGSQPTPNTDSKILLMPARLSS